MRFNLSMTGGQGRFVAPILMLLTLFPGLLAASAWPSTVLADTQTISIQGLLCPTNYSGVEYRTDCNRPFLGTRFQAGGKGQDADETGTASFDISGFGPGTVAIIIESPLPLTTPVPIAWCVNDIGELLGVDFLSDARAGGMVFVVTMPSAANVSCEFYFIFSEDDSDDFTDSSV